MLPTQTFKGKINEQTQLCANEGWVGAFALADQRTVFGPAPFDWWGIDEETCASCVAFGIGWFVHWSHHC